MLTVIAVAAGVAAVVAALTVTFVAVALKEAGEGL
jgi:hypothetical protein